MQLISLTDHELEKNTLTNDYKNSRTIGKIKLGQNALLFKSNFKIYYIPYDDITCYFRRIFQVPTKVCCAPVSLDVENLVVCDQTGEIAQIQLPGKKAAEILMQELKKIIPNASVGKPKQNERI